MVQARDRARRRIAEFRVDDQDVLARKARQFEAAVTIIPGVKVRAIQCCLMDVHRVQVREGCGTR